MGSVSVTSRLQWRDSKIGEKAIKKRYVSAPFLGRESIALFTNQVGGAFPVCTQNSKNRVMATLTPTQFKVLRVMNVPSVERSSRAA